MKPPYRNNQKKKNEQPKLIFQILAIPYLLVFGWSMLALFRDFTDIKPGQSLLWQSTKLMLVWYLVALFFSLFGSMGNINTKMYSVNFKTYYIQDFNTPSKYKQEFNKAFYYWWIPFPIIYSCWPMIKFYWSWGFTGYQNLDHFLIVLFIIGFLSLFLLILYKTYNYIVKKRLNTIAIFSSLPYGFILLGYFLEWLMKT